MNLIIDTEKLTRLIKSFYTLTKIRVAVFDDSFNEILAYPESHSVFCNMMNAAAHEMCTQSAKALCAKCKKENRLVYFTCHAGLTEAASPLYENNATIGYIMFGQITNIKNREEFSQKSRVLCRNYPLDSDEFSKKILTVPYRTTRQLEAVSEIINAFTSYIRLEHLVSVKKEEALHSVISYINENLSLDLSVSAICKHFSISKTVLYELTKPVMKGGIARYIRDVRMNRAKELILSTDKSIEEISGLVGFMDSNYFRRLFKRLNGISANKYRKTQSAEN